MEDWDQLLPFAIFSYNTSVHSSTNFSPFELIFGSEARTPINSTDKKLRPVYNYDDYYCYIKAVLHNMHIIAKNSLQEAKEINKSYYDRKIKSFNIEEGDLVLLESIPKGKGQKLQALREGPYEVSEVISNENVKILVKGKPKLVHKNRLYPYHQNILVLSSK